MSGENGVYIAVEVLAMTGGRWICAKECLCCWGGEAVYAKRRSRNSWEEADFGMNEFPSGGSKLSYRGIRHPASFHSPLDSATHSLATNATPD